MAWATIADVLSYTQISVTQEQVDTAHFVVELFADTTEDASDDGLISSKNLRLLKMAVSFQAAWLTAHPDAFLTVDVNSMNQDGMSFTAQHANAHILAPLAKRCIDRLSWNRNRDIRVRRRGQRGEYIPRTLNKTDADLDDRRSWTPLEDL